MDSFTLDHPAPTVLTVLKYGTQKVPICTRVIVAHLHPNIKMASVFLALLKSLHFPTYAKIACQRRNVTRSHKRGLNSQKGEQSQRLEKRFWSFWVIFTFSQNRLPKYLIYHIPMYSSVIRSLNRLIIVLTTSTLNSKLYVHTNFGSIFLKTVSATPPTFNCL